MKRHIQFVLFLLILSTSAVAQTVPPKEKMTREEKDEKNAARQARIDAKNDYAIFRRQITALKEFSDEKKKLLKLQENSKIPVKVVIAIDSVDEGDTTTKILIGYIVQNVGDNATLRYDISYDRTQKKIVSVKKTQEAIDADKEAEEAKEEKVSEKKPGVKPGVPKKKSEDDEDEEPEEEKPSKTRDRDED